MNCLNTLQKGDRESIAELETEIFRCLAKAFKEVYIIDLEENLIKTYMHEGRRVKDEALVKPATDYTEGITEYVNSLLVPEEQERVLKQLTIDNLRTHFAKYDSMAYECHKVLSEGKMHTYARLRKLNDREIVMGVADIREESYGKSFTNGSKLLVVEDDEINRFLLASIFEDEYQVLEAANGEEALNLLKTHYDDVAVIITDLDMPVCDGKEFIRLARLNHAYDAIPIVVTTASDSKTLELECLKLGASDFATKPYEAEILKNRVKNLCVLRNSTAMLNTITKDPITGLYSKLYFDIKAKEIIDSHPDKEYWLFCSEISQFSMLKDKYGRARVNVIMQYVADAVMKYCPGVVIGGHISDKIFCFLQEKSDDTCNKETVKKINEEAPVGNIEVNYGRVAVDSSLTIETMCDYALMAIDTIKGVYNENMVDFDSSIYAAKKLESDILASMEQAIAEEQFLIYYQPKHNLKSDRTGGAEALVRWVHPEFGFMNPGAFIPLFEKNGFIRRLDGYVWQRVCEDIARWKQEGKPVVPISINISRRDFDDKNLAEHIISLVESYGLEPKDLHLEITESAYSDNPELIAEAIHTLYKHGFVFELDDFGAGYSSLTTLNNVELDVMKIDMSIIRKDEPGSERNVLEMCISLSKLMGMKTVAEGVETKEQVERLRSLGCDYIQGYYYSAPMSCERFEEYLLAN